MIIPHHDRVIAHVMSWEIIPEKPVTAKNTILMSIAYHGYCTRNV